MKNTLLTVLMVIATTFVAVKGFSAELKYNGFSGEWEYAQPGDVMKYNGFDQSWSYESPASTLHYNGFDQEWSYEY
tara:strand:+ start:382 stop:609 length:228 start_codon:yes stop_codon:yes gene_type:complete